MVWVNLSGLWIVLDITIHNISNMNFVEWTTESSIFYCLYLINDEYLLLLIYMNTYMNTPDINELLGRNSFNKYLKDNYLEFYNFLLSNYDNIGLPERLYRFYHNIQTDPICPECGKLLKFQSFGRGYQKYCSKKCSCNSEETRQLVKNTCNQRYGGVGFASTIIKDKINNTRCAKYGDSKFTNRKKATQTQIERYGVTNVLKDPERSKIIHKKMQATFLDRYGVESPLHSEEIKEKIKHTNLERYGDENPMKSKEVQDRVKKTNLERYGVENSTKSDIIKAKQKQTIYNRIVNTDPNIIDVVMGECVKYVCRCQYDCDKCSNRQFLIDHIEYTYRKYTKKILCPKLLPLKKSNIKNTYIEEFVKSILDEYGIEYITNYRKILNGKELDIFIPTKNLAIECNGIYWHCSELKTNNYHFKKYQACADRNIQLLTIWEDQIINHPDIIKSIILSKLGIYKRKIYARNCIIKHITSEICTDFLNQYHLQGNVGSSVRFGLYYNDELVSVMTFGKKRKCMGGKSEWELYRFCNKFGCQVIGGAGKLFKCFIKEYSPDRIESFSSNDISNGSLYKTLNFTKIGKSYSYWYIDRNMKRYHRYNYRKDVLVKMGYDSKLSESQITQQMGLYKIYDSGQSKWEYIV